MASGVNGTKLIDFKGAMTRMSNEIMVTEAQESPRILYKVH